MLSLRFTSGVTPTSLLAASMAASHFPTCMFQQRWDAGFNREISHIMVRHANHSAITTSLLPAATKLGQVMFLQASVILSTRGVCLSACWDTTPPRGRHPPDQTLPGSRPPPPGADHPPRAEHPPGADHHPPDRTSPREADSGIIRSTSGRYTSYWNASLF